MLPLTAPSVHRDPLYGYVFAGGRHLRLSLWTRQGHWTLSADSPDTLWEGKQRFTVIPCDALRVLGAAFLRGQAVFSLLPFVTHFSGSQIKILKL